MQLYKCNGNTVAVKQEALMKMVVHLTKVAGVNLSAVLKLAVKTTEYTAMHEGKW